MYIMQIIALKAAKAEHPTLAPKTQGSLACVKRTTTWTSISVITVIAVHSVFAKKCSVSDGDITCVLAI